MGQRDFRFYDAPEWFPFGGRQLPDAEEVRHCSDWAADDPLTTWEHHWIDLGGEG